MVPNSFVSSLSMCLFCACTFSVETDPTKVCSGKGAVTLWASPASEENQKISSPCPQDAEKPESKWSGCRVNWKILPCSNIVWRQFRVLGWVFCCYLIFKLKIKAWDPIAVGNLFFKNQTRLYISKGRDGLLLSSSAWLLSHQLKFVYSSLLLLGAPRILI